MRTDGTKVALRIGIGAANKHEQRDQTPPYQRQAVDSTVSITFTSTDRKEKMELNKTFSNQLAQSNPDKPRHRITIESKHLAVIATLLVLFALYAAKTLILPIFIAIFFALLLNPLVCLLHKLKIPRAVSSAAVVAILLSVTIAAMSLLVEPAQKWINKIPEVSKQISEKIDAASQPFSSNKEKPWYVLEKDIPPPVSGKIMEQVTLSATRVLTMLTPVILMQFFMIIVLILFFLMYGDSLYRNIISSLNGFSKKRVMVIIGRTIQTDISYYVLIISAINTLLGLATALALWTLDVDDALLWGGMAALFNFLPYVGPFCVMLILTFVGVLQYGFNFIAFHAPLAFLVINTIESQFLTPTILGERFSINPLIVVLWLSIIGWMWGVAGMLFAVPMLVSFRVLVSNVRRLSYWKKIVE